MLAEHNIPVWMDRIMISAGDDWDSQIGTALRRCVMAICFLSLNFFDSVNCKSELKSIRRRIEHKEPVKLLPVTLYECEVYVSILLHIFSISTGA